MYFYIKSLPLIVYNKRTRKDLFKVEGIKGAVVVIKKEPK